MGKINILDSSVFNRIAAGEVVERPCSIVKELVENAIDAGAKNVSVEILRGGIDLIRVADDGCGIESDDLEKAFLPHSTSKIKELKDLNDISTLGFRGEALTSIASVAKVTLLSKTSNDELGGYVIIENGKILERGERGRARGTTVTVEGLFENVPARAKFLAKPSTEESVITDMMSRLIMTYHSVNIKYTANEKVIYQSAGDGLKKAVYSVYGKEFIDNMEPIECIMSGIALRGLINKPYFTKPNRTFQTLIVNGRYVINSDISYVVYNCYRDYLMKRQFPAYVIEIEIPSDMVDVNVHPSKSEIKFADFDSVKRIIYTTVKTRLEEMTGIPKDVSLSDTTNMSPYDLKEELKGEAVNDGASIKAGSAIGSFFTIEPKTSSGYSSSKICSASEKNGSERLKEYFSELSNRKPINAFERLSAKITGKGDDRCAEQINSFEQVTFSDVIKNVDDALTMRPKFKTVLFDTYIVLESGNDIYMIDQHAAHERLLFDKLAGEVEAGSVVVQNMLLPYVFKLTPKEGELLRQRLQEINECGFEINELSGGAFSLSAVPMLCSDMKKESFVSMILDGLSDMRYRRTDFVKDILMQSACKAAIKGEDKLAESEIEYLIKQFEAGDKVLMCPHGRPLVVKISKSEIEKWFKRVI